MNRLLNFYSSLAKRLYKFRGIFWFLAVIALIVFIAAIFLTAGRESMFYTLGSSLVLVWAVGVNVLISGFSGPMRTMSSDDGLLLRIKMRASNGFRWFLVLFTTAVLIATIFFSLRVVGILTSG
jgi:hypothetical protein